MIKDTCTCGAKFEISSRPLDEQQHHRDWLASHAVCRESRAASEPGWPDILPAPKYLDVDLKEMVEGGKK